MKNLAKIPIICFVFFVMIQTFYAQAKKKALAPKEPITFIEKIFKTNLDEATLLLDEELSEIGVVFKKVEDEKDYIYDQELKKTDTINSIFKHLITDNSYRFTLIGDKNNVVIGFSLSNYPANDDLLSKIIQKLGIKNWSLVETKGERSLYKKGKLFASINSGEYFSCEIFVPIVLLASQPVDSLTLRSSFAENRNFVTELMNKMGYKLLSAKKRAVYNKTDTPAYDFISYYQTLYYNQGTEVTIMMDENKKSTITISNPNAIIFSSIKTKLTDNTWNQKYTNSVYNTTYFRKNNRMMSIAPSLNQIQLYSVAAANDNESKLVYGSLLYLYELEEIYSGFTFEDRIAYMNDHFAVSDVYDTPTFIIKKKDATIRYIFYDDKTSKEYALLKYSVDNDNPAIADLYYKNVIENFPSLTSQNFALTIGKNKLPHRTQFYDKTIYTANVLSEQAKESAQLLADQRAAAEQKQRDILREQEKARRNAELTNTINQTTNELLKLLQK
ncbi:hypothetical protein ACLB9Y_03390 [Chryseobacterium scophthalmum]|uniref:hypothetical protein n=1 Tax=Chryseobacterium scophthalmum TaxID=59733 RepID=UPI00398B40C9